MVRLGVALPVRLGLSRLDYVSCRTQGRHARMVGASSTGSVAVGGGRAIRPCVPRSQEETERLCSASPNRRLPIPRGSSGVSTTDRTCYRLGCGVRARSGRVSVPSRESSGHRQTENLMPVRIAGAAKTSGKPMSLCRNPFDPKGASNASEQLS